MDLYQILEIKPTSSKTDIKKAYLKLAKIYHPDKNNNLNTEKFQKIKAAYDILINDKTRQEYHMMDHHDKISFMEILEKILKDNMQLDEFKKYNINLNNIDFEYIKDNFINFFHAINIEELLQLFRGLVPKKDFNNINCSETDVDTYDEAFAEYYYQLPIYYQKFNKLDIKIELPINLIDIINNNKRKIKIKRKINNSYDDTVMFIFNMSSPYIIFKGAGDCNNDECGNLIIKLHLQINDNNLYWDDKLILIEYPMTLYEMIYGLDIFFDLGEYNKITINNWIPNRDGFIIEVNNIDNIKINLLSMKYKIIIKLYLNYENNNQKEELLKKYFN